MPRDFQQRFPFFSCFSDSTNELVVPNALAVIQLASTEQKVGDDRVSSTMGIRATGRGRP
jgi:hypothetical protein